MIFSSSLSPRVSNGDVNVLKDIVTHCIRRDLNVFFSGFDGVRRSTCVLGSFPVYLLKKWFTSSVHPSLHPSITCSSCPTLCDPMNLACQAPLLAGSPSKNTGVSSHFLIQGIFLIQGLNPPLPALQVDSLPLEPLWKRFP